MSWMFPTRIPQLVAASDALPGRDTPVLTDPQPHTVLHAPIPGPWRDGQKSVIIGLGCFWGAEKLLWQLDGVESTSVGYAGGVTPNPTYREVCSGKTNHAEVVEVTYDPEKVSFETIVATALEAHDPTQGFRQGNDVGTQYRSAIYTTGADAEADADKARKLVEGFGQSLVERGFGEITTEVKPLSETPSGAYYLAEGEHQQYLDKNPGGYCPVHSTGVACQL